MLVTKHKLKAVFFDRDGVLNHLVQRDGSFYSPQNFDDFHIVNEAKEAVDIIKEMGFLTIVVSNQPDISRGKLKQSELDQMTDMIFKNLCVDDVFYCIHDDENDTGCRKPAPGLFITAQKKYNIDFNKSYMIGDTWKDVEAAKSVGIPMILLDKDYNQTIKDIKRVNNLKELILLITSDSIHEKS
ncbi:HAD-IIIA family hydrolase [bacterium]|nr:HAD-IIIA family hydrolase [bacterium]